MEGTYRSIFRQIYWTILPVSATTAADRSGRLPSYHHWAI